MKLICLGDSITGKSDLSKFMKWSCVLSCMIDAVKGERQVDVINRGIPGDTTDGVLARLDNDVLAEQPDIVVMLLSGNDAGKNTPKEQVKANLDSIVSQIKATGAKLLLLQYHLLPNPANPDKAWTHLPTNNDIIAEIAAKHQCPVLPMGPPMTEALNEYSHAELVNTDDGVHLNPAGELVFARSVFRKLRELDWV